MDELTSDMVLEQLQPIFQEVLSSPGLVITVQSNALNTTNWDSLAHIELIELVEMHFGVRFALGELQDLHNVGDMVTLILEKKERAAKRL